ncbi:hypothetical protein SDRG_01081 [Saprolegnia diclina VS20]|uniref:BTB domain-containing protein n=1 Tax=Saprolegnia diclina (strain VS20) TaxID=1156394 RepID=T0SH04_SAPDV|nr:hypothetical protein SDRG_01081 [Saprolegnia diclina VS20]EQC42247.1 hypothetical protein SDRG_01081 [Saprolegnia diclina VS20]|eukprot:XP_008604816.1 hypothetical protein SDRG_01081 [Saprolegnia diclina VS20]
MNRNVRGDNVEFTVKAVEDLVLSGTERSVVRVPANNMYSCLMQKTQRFSSLFRHYSKHHGLPRESLDFCFMNLLSLEDSPESVHLQKNDVIHVRHRRPLAIVPPPRLSDEEYFTSMRRLLESGDNSDVVLRVGADAKELRGHKLILTTRCEVFNAMLRSDSMRESENGVVVLRDDCPDMVRRLLEFIYTNRIADLAMLTATQLIELLALAEQYLLRTMKELCEAAAVELISNDHCAKLLSAAERYNAQFLKDSCVKHIVENMQDIVDEDAFCHEIQQCPSLAIIIMKAHSAHSTSFSPEPAAKRRRFNMPNEESDYE